MSDVRGEEFELLVGPHRSALRLHCYRMLGSSHDGDDMVQETLVRAFRARDRLEDPGAVRAWLHRIATRVCIDELGKRDRRARGPELHPPNDPDEPPAEAGNPADWIEPCPGSWLDGAGVDPDAAYTLSESVALAFVAALQVLTPGQRAVLLLRDVVGLSAEETAAALDVSVAASNSTLHRARSALEERVGQRADWAPPDDAAVDRELLARYLSAWNSGDLTAIVALLHDDARLSMPPHPSWYQGRAAIERFFARRLTEALRQRRFRATATSANGRPAAAFYRVAETGEAHLFAVQVLERRGGLVRDIDHFMGEAALAVLGLPPVLR